MLKTLERHAFCYRQKPLYFKLYRVYKGHFYPDAKFVYLVSAMQVDIACLFSKLPFDDSQRAMHTT